MAKKNQLLFLGTGASSGVPMIGCNCPVCQSDDPHNKRLRPSALISICGKQLLIDVGPDFRQQALLYGIKHIDGVLLTHAHYDHVAGLDELRVFYIQQKMPMPVLCSIDTIDELKKKFDYLFKSKEEGISLAAQLHYQLLDSQAGKTEFIGVPIEYVSYMQGNMLVNGYRFGKFAYLTDIKKYSNDIFEELKGVEILVISAIEDHSSNMHINFSEAALFAKHLGVKQCYFTHITHSTDHQQINRILPKECALAYDGLLLEWV